MFLSPFVDKEIEVSSSKHLNAIVVVQQNTRVRLIRPFSFVGVVVCYVLCFHGDKNGFLSVLIAGEELCVGIPFPGLCFWSFL
ncbi:hypothetical protein V6N11_013712 [Hibiscus sabdariffa]|uniref:Transmembrane protein n=1 Tax=Hibiscus sabdariffa TaxID=183260 RepID=A0ABR2A361_9ROSI